MSKRQLQRFLLRFTAGVAASLLSGLAVIQPMFWIGMVALGLWIAFWAFGIAAKWRAYIYQKTSVNARYEAIAPTHKPIEIDELITSTSGLITWFLAISIGVLLVLCPQLFTSIWTALSAAH